MSLVGLSNLYCTDADLYDYLGSEGVQLRLDDHNESTGQVIQATVDAPLGAVSLSVAPLSGRLYRGAVLAFDGAGMDALVEVTLTVTALPGSITLGVTPLPGPVTAQAVAFDAGVNLVQQSRLLKAREYATAQVKLYCCQRYNDADLATSWSVNRWATILGGRWLAKRRAQAAPAGIESDYEEAVAELKQVRVGMLSVEDIATRSAGQPFFSNVRRDITYDVAAIRVEPNISEGTPTQYAQYVDWLSVFWGEWW